jgi:polyisoprenoid-binding protein YceI
MPSRNLSRFAAIFALSLIPVVAAEGNPPLPAPGVYTIDPAHTFAYFAAWHHIVGTVRGRFDKVTGTFTVSSDPANCAVDVVIATYSVNTQNSYRDDDLRSPAFFDVVKFPTATYRGRGIRRVSDDSWVMDGSLTIRGFTTVVPLTLSYKGVFPDTKPGEPARVAFHATAGARRAAFGMTRDNLTELGPNPPPKPDVEIQIDVEADAGEPK